MTPTAYAAPALSTAARTFLESFAAHDLPRLGSVLADEVQMRALVPSGLREVGGPRQVCDLFAFFFRDVDRFELVDASAGEVGAMLSLRWRVRVTGGRFDHPHLVEQQAYARVTPSGLVDEIALVCSGFQPDDAPDSLEGS